MRNSNVRSARPRTNSPAFGDRIISALSYLSMGAVAFLWFIYAKITHKQMSKFLRFNIAQSLFISCAYFLICYGLGLVVDLLSPIPFVNTLLLQLSFYLNMQWIFGFSIIEFFVTFFVLYLTWTSFIGQVSFVPWFTPIAKT